MGAAFGGQASTGTSPLSLTNVTAGATIVVSVLSANATASAFSVSDAQGAYSAIDSIIGTGTGATSSQTFILTNANAGTHLIAATATGDTIIGILAAWYTGVGGVDNSGAAHSNSLNTSTGTGANVCNSGNLTTTTPGSMIVCFGWDDNLLAFSAGTSPNAFNSRFTGTPSGSDAALIEDFVFSSTGSIAATAGKASSSTYAILQAIALAAVASGPTINTQPVNAYAIPGQSVSFSVSATSSGGSLTYQWYKNGVSIGGATSSSYSVTPNFPLDYGSYWYCIVTDSNGSTQTSNAQVLWLLERFRRLSLNAMDLGDQDYKSELTLKRWF